MCPDYVGGGVVRKAGGYTDLEYGEAELAQAMRETYDELIDFVTTPEFKAPNERIWRTRPESPTVIRS